MTIPVLPSSYTYFLDSLIDGVRNLFDGKVQNRFHSFENIERAIMDCDRISSELISKNQFHDLELVKLCFLQTKTVESLYSSTTSCCSVEDKSTILRLLRMYNMVVFKQNLSTYRDKEYLRKSLSFKLFANKVNIVSYLVRNSCSASQPMDIRVQSMLTLWSFVLANSFTVDYFMKSKCLEVIFSLVERDYPVAKARNWVVCAVGILYSALSTCCKLIPVVAESEAVRKSVARLLRSTDCLLTKLYCYFVLSYILGSRKTFQNCGSTEEVIQFAVRDIEQLLSRQDRSLNEDNVLGGALALVSSLAYENKKNHLLLLSRSFMGSLSQMIEDENRLSQIRAISVFSSFFYFKGNILPHSDREDGFLLSVFKEMKTFARVSEIMLQSKQDSVLFYSCYVALVHMASISREYAEQFLDLCRELKDKMVKYYHSMLDLEIDPNSFHYHCLVTTNLYKSETLASKDNRMKKELDEFLIGSGFIETAFSFLGFYANDIENESNLVGWGHWCKIQAMEVLVYLCNDNEKVQNKITEIDGIRVLWEFLNYNSDDLTVVLGVCKLLTECCYEPYNYQNAETLRGLLKDDKSRLMEKLVNSYQYKI